MNQGAKVEKLAECCLRKWNVEARQHRTVLDLLQPGLKLADQSNNLVRANDVEIEILSESGVGRIPQIEPCLSCGIHDQISGMKTERILVDRQCRRRNRRDIKFDSFPYIQRHVNR